MVAKYSAKRAELKKIMNGDDYDAKRAADIALQKLPPNSNPIRMHNRCKLTGRPKGYIRQFGLSRINFREMAMAGLIPGVKKAKFRRLQYEYRSDIRLFNSFEKRNPR